MTPLPVKKMDSRGRLTLGPEYANEQFFVQRQEDGTIRLIPAETVPAPEAWLYRNPKAIKAVLTGLDQAGRGDFAEGPDLDQAIRQTESVEED